MAKQLSLAGTGVALITPFDNKGRVDYAALTRMVNHVIKGGVNYIVVLGTTGEPATMSDGERHEVSQHVIRIAGGRVKIVLGIGGNNTATVLQRFSPFDAKGIDAILSVTPYYNKPSQAGLIQHFGAIAKASPLPVIIYNVPGRTGVNMSADTQLALAHAHSNIIATKEASGNMEQIMKILKHKPRGFEVISGDDNLTLAMLACGATGVISVSANAYPKIMSTMVHAALQNEMAKARKQHYRLLDITNMIFEEGSPAGVKEILQQMKLCTNVVRMPLANVSDSLAARIVAEMKSV